MKIWIASLLGGFMGFVLAAFPFAGGGRVGYRPMLFMLGSAVIGAAVGHQVFARCHLMKRGAATQVGFAGVLGGCVGLALFSWSRVLGLWSAGSVPLYAVLWTVAGAALAMLGIVIIWLQLGEVPFVERDKS